MSHTYTFFKEVIPVIDPRIRFLCRTPYPLHKNGCPNYGHRASCPPEAPLLRDLILLDVRQPIYIIYNKFNFKEHCKKMKEKHPTWSKRQIECCLYWQRRARKQLKEKIKIFLTQHPHYDIVACPEGSGVNLTETMKSIGIKLEWPPVNYAYQIVLAGIPIKTDKFFVIFNQPHC